MVTTEEKEQQVSLSQDSEGKRRGASLKEKIIQPRVQRRY